MTMLGPLGFAAPWVLMAALALPVLWWLLRAVPPAPREIVFPGTPLLAGLVDPAPVARRTPWWLLLLRMGAMALAILAFAGPVWRPDPQPAGQGPLLVVMDAGWAAAPDWTAAQARAGAALEQAESAGRPAALLLADGQGAGPLIFGTGAEAAARLRAAVPQPWRTRYPEPGAALAEAPARFDTLWLADGLDHPGRARLLEALAARGQVTVAPSRRPVRALVLTGGPAPALILRATGTGPLPAVLAIGPDPQGTLRELARLPAPEPRVIDGIAIADLPIDLPPELRNRVIRFALEDEPSAGAVVLADDRMRRRKVALVGDTRQTEGQQLLSPLHYIRQALAPSADLVEGGISDVLPAAPDVVILSDVLPAGHAGELAQWVRDGGLLIRFAGPRMAASGALADDSLLPVRLRPGGRDAGGALSWGEPRGIAPFAAQGPFAGLAVPADVTVRAQLLPEPDPGLSARTIAQLTDGTPLVTREVLGEGQIVLFHTSANADWTNLPLSGLFVQMLDRLVQSARATLAEKAASAEEAAYWTAEMVLDGFGRPRPPGALAPVTAEDLAAGPGVPAGVYAAGERRVALNAGGPLALAGWPGAMVLRGEARPGLDLRGWLLALAAVLLALDAAGSGWLAGSRRKALA